MTVAPNFMTTEMQYADDIDLADHQDPRRTAGGIQQCKTRDAASRIGF